MTITRVIRDDVEFFTIEATGESGMSESGLARLCNVSRQSVSELLRSILSGKLEISPLKPLQRKDIWVQARNLSLIDNSNISHISIVRAEICTHVVQHYAFHSRHRTDEALFALQKFSILGVR